MAGESHFVRMLNAFQQWSDHKEQQLAKKKQLSVPKYILHKIKRKVTNEKNYLPHRTGKKSQYFLQYKSLRAHKKKIDFSKRIMNGQTQYVFTYSQNKIIRILFTYQVCSELKKYNNFLVWIQWHSLMFIWSWYNKLVQISEEQFDYLLTRNSF